MRVGGGGDVCGNPGWKLSPDPACVLLPPRQTQCIDWGYKARDVIGLDKYKNLMAWCERIGSRAAVKQGRLVNNGWSEGGQKDYSTDGKK